MLTRGSSGVGVATYNAKQLAGAFCALTGDSRFCSAGL
jgi:hypothetical protein